MQIIQQTFQQAIIMARLTNRFRLQIKNHLHFPSSIVIIGAIKVSLMDGRVI